MTVCFGKETACLKNKSITQREYKKNKFKNPKKEFSDFYFTSKKKKLRLELEKKHNILYNIKVYLQNSNNGETNGKNNL